MRNALFAIAGATGVAAALAFACGPPPAPIDPSGNGALAFEDARPDDAAALVDAAPTAEGGTATLQRATNAFARPRLPLVLANDAGATTADAPVDAGPTSAAEDDRIARDVRANMAKDPALASDLHRVTVIVKNGVVTLRGTVKNEPARAAIESAARKPAGVRGVKSELHAHDQTPIDLEPGPTGY